MFNIGEIITYFRLSIPEDTAEGYYLVEWDAYGDYDPPMYTPIEPTTV
mgnify:CR=1 FL=1